MNENLIGKGINILVAENDFDNSERLKAYLEMLGSRVSYVKNGIEAIDKIAEKRYDICFMALRMPLMGGIDAVNIIREEGKNNLPIVAMVDEVTDQDFKDCLDAQFNDLITKPIDIVKLKKIIRNCSGTS